MKAAGVILAGGLHPEIKPHYFRIGHMEAGRRGCGYGFEPGMRVVTAQAVMQREWLVEWSSGSLVGRIARPQAGFSIRDGDWGYQWAAPQHVQCSADGRRQRGMLGPLVSR